MSCSGGEASLVADAGLNVDLEFRALRETDAQRVRDTLNELVVAANPLDYHTFIWGDEAALKATFSAMLECKFDLNFLILDFPRRDRCSDHDWDPTVAAIGAATRATGQRVAVVTSLPESLPEHRAAELLAAGIAPLHGLDDALAAASAAASVGEAWAKAMPQLWSTPRDDSKQNQTFSESESKHALNAFGLSVPQAQEATSAEAAIAIAHTIGFPVVMKAVGLAHKSEHNGVMVNLVDSTAVSNAWDHLATLSDTVLIEQMIDDVVVELLIGVHRDSVYGHLLTVGAGGVLVELLADTCTLRMPVTELDVRHALASLKIAPLLRGYRGKPAGDTEAVVAAVMAVQRYVTDSRQRLREIDVNPLMVRTVGNGAVAADALIVS